MNFNINQQKFKDNTIFNDVLSLRIGGKYLPIAHDTILLYNPVVSTNPFVGSHPTYPTFVGLNPNRVYPTFVGMNPNEVAHGQGWFGTWAGGRGLLPTGAGP